MQVYNIYVDRFHCNVTHSKDFTIHVLGFRSEGPLPFFVVEIFSAKTTNIKLLENIELYSIGQ